MLKPRKRGNAAQHDEDEEQAGRVEGGHQLAEREQRADAVLADGEGHGAERAERRDPMTMPTMRRRRASGLVDDVEHRLPRSPSASSAMPNRTEKNSTCRMSPSAKAPTTVSGMMFMRKLDDALVVRLGGVGGDRLGVERGRIDVHAGARAAQS